MFCLLKSYIGKGGAGGTPHNTCMYHPGITLPNETYLKGHNLRRTKFAEFLKNSAIMSAENLVRRKLGLP